MSETYKCPHCNQDFKTNIEFYSDPNIDYCPNCNEPLEWESGFRDQEDGWYCFPIKPLEVGK